VAGQTVVLRGMARIISIVLIVVLAVPCSSFGSAKINVLAVTAVRDGNSDDVAVELSGSLAKALRQATSLRVVGAPLVRDVANYKSSGSKSGQKDAANTEDGLKEASEDLRRANEEFFKLKNKSAAAYARKAANALESSPLNMSKKGRLMVDAYLTLALIHQASSNKNEMRTALERVLKVEPTYVLDEKSYPPSLRKMFDEVRTGIIGNGGGVIRVDSKPRAVDVFLNGIAKGVTPLEISNLPAGHYQITLSANNCSSVQKDVKLDAGDKISIKEKMKRGEASEVKVLKVDDVDLVAEGVSLGNSLKADKVVFVDVDENGSGKGEISARMIDVRYKAGIRPIVIRYDSKRKGVEESLSEMVSRLLEDVSVDVSKDPSLRINPLGVNDPLLLGENSKQRKISKRNLLMIIGGAALVAGGATAAALLIGGGGDKGSLHVQFKFK
jgi:hypothetical protein